MSGFRFAPRNGIAVEISVTRYASYSESVLPHYSIEYSDHGTFSPIRQCLAEANSLIGADLRRNGSSSAPSPTKSNVFVDVRRALPFKTYSTLRTRA